MDMLFVVFDNMGFFNLLSDVGLGGDLSELLVDLNELLGEYNGLILLFFSYKVFFRERYFVLEVDFKDLELLFVFLVYVYVRSVIDV